LTRHVRAETAGLTPVLPDAAAEYFRMDVLTPRADVPAGFAVAVALSGAGTVRPSVGDPVAVRAGDTAVVPSASGEWHVDGELRLLVCRPGESWPPARTPKEPEGTP
jgi:mannose-6-phosphate isomerase